MKIFLSLQFRDDGELSLERTIFRSPLFPVPLVSVRGKSAWGIKSTGSFEWSSAVRALAVLFVQTQIDPSFILRGEMARTLDFALAKKPTWLREMFGIGNNFNLCSRLFLRSSTEERRLGDFYVRLHRQQLADSELEIKFNGLVVNQETQLKSLIDRLLASSAGSASSSLRELLRSSIEAELRFSLSRPDVLSLEGQYGFAQALCNSAIPTRLNGAQAAQFLQSYRSPEMNGFSIANAIARFVDLPPLNIQVPAGGVTTLALLHRVRRWGVPLNIDCHYPMAYYLARDLLKGNLKNVPDLLVTGIVPLMHLLRFRSRHDYTMLMPVNVQSAWLLSSQDSDPSKLSYFRGEPTNMMFVEEKVKQSAIGAIAVSQSHAEILSDVQKGRLQTLASVIAPFGCLAVKLGAKAEMISGPGYSGHLQFLMVRRDLVGDPRVSLLEQALHRAWMDLIFDPKAVLLAVNSLMAEPDIVAQLGTEGGFQQLAA